MSERYIPRHKAGPVTTTGPVPRLRGLLGVVIGLTVGLMLGSTFSGASAASVGFTAATKQTCPPGIEKNKPWLCPTPSPSPSSSPSPSPSPSTTTPSPSPSPTPTASPTPSASPTPTPTPTATGLLTNCVNQLAACGYPTTASVGVLAGTALTPFTGDFYVMTAGQVVQNMEVDGCIWVHAPGVIITNTRVRMADRCFYGISTYDAQGGLTVIDKVEVVCNYAHGSAVAGPGLRLSRSWLHACENGLEVNANSVVEDSVIAGSEQGPGDPHGDGIQSQGGNNVTIRHNTLLQINPVTSAIITNPTANNTWLVESNFLGGGAYTLYCPEQGTGWTVRNNRFVPAKTGGLYSAAYGLTDACGHAGIVWTGNYRDNDLSVVNP